MKHALIIFCCVSFFAEASLKPIIFPHPLLNLKSYEIQAHGQTFSDYYVSAHPTPNNEQKLLDLFEFAQKYYAVNSKDLALIHYKKMIEMIFLDDWKPLQRQALTLALFRLAELEPQGPWLSKALSYGSDIDFGTLNLSDSTLQLIKQSPKPANIDWELSNWSHYFDFILINGRVVDLQEIKKIRLPQGEYRIVFISSYYLPQILQVSHQQIPLLQPVQIPFVSGSCKSPVLQIDAMPDSELLFSDCHLKRDQNKWVSKNINLNPEATPNINSEPSLTSLYAQSEKEPFYKNKWFWVGAGIVVGAVVYYVHHQKSKGESSAPSSTVIGEF